MEEVRVRLHLVSAVTLLESSSANLVLSETFVFEDGNTPRNHSAGVGDAFAVPQSEGNKQVHRLSEFLF